MAIGTLTRHGTEAGYRAELTTESVCARCRKGHQMYDRYSRLARRGKRAKPDRFATLDSEWTPARTAPKPSRPVQAASSPVTALHSAAQSSPVESSTEPEEGSYTVSLGDRLASRIRDMALGAPGESPEYVPEDNTGYVHEIEDTDSPGPEWDVADDAEFIVNAAGLKKIESNLGTYLSIVGMTVEMIDPICGPVLAQNFDNIVSHWAKVISHYPKAAELFMDGKGGVIFTWIGALQATWPFLYVIYQHHLAKSIVMAPNGKIYRKNEMPGSNGQTVDPLQPEFQYSAT